MIATEIGRVVFTAVFGALAMQAVWTLASAHGVFALVHHLGELVMSLGMASMAWPLWLQWPTSPQVGLYLMLAFASVAVLCRQLRSRLGLGGWVGLLRMHHVVMLVAMVWMVTAMGNAPRDLAAVGHTHGGAGLGFLTSVSGVALAALTLVLTIAVVVQYATCADDDPECGAGATTSCALMGAGMVAMSWTMIAS